MGHRLRRSSAAVATATFTPAPSGRPPGCRGAAAVDPGTLPLGLAGRAELGEAKRVTHPIFQIDQPYVAHKWPQDGPD